MDATLDRYVGALLGLAVGDAVGTTVEFRPRGTFTPVTDMVGGGPFGLAPGEWTDDTSMALCLATSLLECGGFDPRDQMERYCRWWDEGYLSSNGRCFDIGITIREALTRFKQSGDPFSGSAHPQKAGNGSIMRLAPVVLFYHPDRDSAVHHAAESSRTTHATGECLDACRLLASILCRALDSEPPDAVLLGDAATFTGAPSIESIARGDYRDKKQDHIVGSGYVVRSLEAAIWSVWTTDSFEAAILRAANLGDDADTTAAVAGQIAGALYGMSGIPHNWLRRLALREAIEDLGTRLTGTAMPAAPSEE